MGWEERNGQRYYYRKRRVGDRVISEYVGTGKLAEMAAALDDLERAREKSQQQDRQQERAQYGALESDVKRVQEYTRLLTRAALLLAGYHPHKGQWRKRKDG